MMYLRAGASKYLFYGPQVPLPFHWERSIELLSLLGSWLGTLTRIGSHLWRTRTFPSPLLFQLEMLFETVHRRSWLARGNILWTEAIKLLGTFPRVKDISFFFVSAFSFGRWTSLFAEYWFAIEKWVCLFFSSYLRPKSVYILETRGSKKICMEQRNLSIISDNKIFYNQNCLLLRKAPTQSCEPGPVVRAIEALSR